MAEANFCARNIVLHPKIPPVANRGEVQTTRRKYYFNEL